MTVLLVAAVLAAAAVGLLWLNARRYVRRAEAAWPAEGAFIDAGSATLHVRDAGAGPPLLLIHGASSNLRELWGPLAQEFTPLHRVIAYDRPGMGYSSRPRRGTERLGEQARCAAALLEAADAAPALIVGHSLGAAVALRLALDRPDLVRGLVLVAPACNPYPGQPAWWARLSAAPIVGAAFCHLIVPWLGPAMSAASIANNFWPSPAPAGYAEDAGVGLIFRPCAFRASACDVCASKAEFAAQSPRYGELFIPAVIVTAEKDRIVSPKRHARALASELPAAELVIAPDAGHMPHRLRTDLVVAAIRRVNEMAAETAQS